MRLTVPGNILLLGEYAVTEEGGIGLAVAVERRVRVALHPWDELLIQGSWPGASVSWSPGSPGAPLLGAAVTWPSGPAGSISSSPLLAAVVEATRAWLRSAGRRDAWKTRVTVDSTALFGADGRKLGLGSSAAVAEIILKIEPLVANLGAVGLWLLVAGGIAYTVGTIFYVLKKIRYMHAVWHVFVLSGSVLHFLAVFFSFPSA